MTKTSQRAGLVTSGLVIIFFITAKGWKEVQDIRQEHEDLYTKKGALQQEISERESKSREFRDVWIYTGFGGVLIVLGTVLYRRMVVWSGLSVVIAGFTVFEYWASPTFFGGAAAEFHALLVSKTILTVIALVALYVVWRVMAVDSKISPDETKA